MFVRLFVSGVDIARASIIGQITLGWPLSPMIGTFFLVGVFMTGFACLTGLFG